MAQVNFDANQVKPNETPSPIPTNEYVAAIVSSEFTPTKAGDGSYLKLQFQVLDGEYNGRKVTARLNLNNSSTEAVEIARGHLSAICHATGVMQVQDTQQLHNIPLLIGVTLRPAHGNFQASNDVKSFSAAPSSFAGANGGVQPQQQPQMQPQMQPQQPQMQPQMQPQQQPVAQQQPQSQQPQQEQPAQQNVQQPPAQQQTGYAPQPGQQPQAAPGANVDWS